MTVSRKLAITQAVLFAIMTILGIVVVAVGMKQVSASADYFSALRAVVFVMILSILIAIAGFVIGILQIVYKAKEQTSGVYLAAGICAIIGAMAVLPFIGIALGLVVLILNVIGIIIRD